MCSLRGERDVPGVPRPLGSLASPHTEQRHKVPRSQSHFASGRPRDCSVAALGRPGAPPPPPGQVPPPPWEAPSLRARRSRGSGLCRGDVGTWAPVCSGWWVAVVAGSPDGPVLRDSGPWEAALCSRGTDGWEGDSSRRVHPALCGGAFPGQTAVKIRSRYGSKLRRVIPRCGGGEGPQRVTAWGRRPAGGPRARHWVRRERGPHQKSQQSR